MPVRILPCMWLGLVRQGRVVCGDVEVVASLALWLYVEPFGALPQATHRPTPLILLPHGALQ